MGIQEGGLLAAEALLPARYFMYSQVYFHPVRRIYDIHLMDFLKEWLPNGQFSTSEEKHLCLSDNDVLSDLLKAARRQSDNNSSRFAERVIGRQHFKLLYERNLSDVETNRTAGQAAYVALSDEFGCEFFRHDHYRQRSGVPDFPLQLNSGEVTSQLTRTKNLISVPIVTIDRVYADQAVHNKAQMWLDENLRDIVRPHTETEQETDND